MNRYNISYHFVNNPKNFQSIYRAGRGLPEFVISLQYYCGEVNFGHLKTGIHVSNTDQEKWKHLPYLVPVLNHFSQFHLARIIITVSSFLSIKRLAFFPLKILLYRRRVPTTAATTLYFSSHSTKRHKMTPTEKFDLTNIFFLLLTCTNRWPPPTNAWEKE